MFRSQASLTRGSLLNRTSVLLETQGLRTVTAGYAARVQTPTDLDDLTDFFDRYGTALTRGDVSAIAGCYALPGMVVADSYSFTFASPAAVALSFLGAAPAYREQQIVAAHAQLHDVQRLSPALAMVAVQWEYLDSRGDAVPGESYRYLLRSEADGPRITTVISTH
jgi:hypothetical protein